MKSLFPKHGGFLRLALATALLAAPLLAADAPSSQWLSTSTKLTPTSLAILNEQAGKATGLKPRLALAPEDAITTREAVAASMEPGRTPNYLRALATTPNGARSFAQLLKTAIFSGELAPETKLAMGLRVAQLHHSAYVAAHFQRLLRGCPKGATWLKALNEDKVSALPVADRLALRYAELLTQNVHGVEEAEFQRMRGYFNDSQIVELTLTTCLWNYFTRLSSGWNLPLENWALPKAQSTFTPPATLYKPPFARVGLISDEEVAAFAEPAPANGVTISANASTRPATQTTPEKTAVGSAGSQSTGGLGIRVTNAKRAMMRSPLFGTAWFNYWRASREGGPQEISIGRETLLQVSFAVSMANGCRYCTLHQVQGLRRLNVDPAKLVAMKKDDSALTPHERVAVAFARKLTRDPASLSDTDFATLEREFGVSGAREVLLQTCGFNFMNRFTDGLNLPSEDEAVHTYLEVYGTDWH